MAVGQFSEPFEIEIKDTYGIFQAVGAVYAASPYTAIAADLTRLYDINSLELPPSMEGRGYMTGFGLLSAQRYFPTRKSVPLGLRKGTFTWSSAALSGECCSKPVMQCPDHLCLLCNRPSRLIASSPHALALLGILLALTLVSHQAHFDALLVPPQVFHLVRGQGLKGLHLDVVRHGSQLSASRSRAKLQSPPPLVLPSDISSMSDKFPAILDAGATITQPPTIEDPIILNRLSSDAHDLDEDQE
ncbi:hypothetical protein HYQ46_002434 [Verticillium longisporum]|nr:hypothetical protein HYQ44_004262 [Verticillium longisporum]KAG7148700.1 hypothetical protein HYQ46_002434 [Verticillium longisporum]